MRIANLAESTQIAYLFEIERLAKHYGTSPADLDGEQLRDWILTGSGSHVTSGGADTASSHEETEGES